MKINGETVEFKSKGSFFVKELTGQKPNTERLLSKSDQYDILSCKRIKIQMVENPKNFFERKITDITVCNEILGKYLVVISWKHEEEMIR